MRKSLERNLYNGSETWREDSLINDNSKYLKSFGKRNKFQFQFFFCKEKKKRHYANGVRIWNFFPSLFRLNRLDIAFVDKNIFKCIQLTFLAKK